MGGTAGNIAVWAGETADHSGGGVANLTDTFRSSFYYAWQLGALPQYGVELAAIGDRMKKARSSSDHAQAAAVAEEYKRFLADCERWFGQKITKLKSTQYQDAMEVCEKQRFLSSENGAPCTSAMKKTPANGIWGLGDVEIFGYTADEKHRLEQWKIDNTERRIECPLIDQGVSKSECFDILMAAGIELPAMYRLGFRNNNCIGCVKARDAIDYWKRVRKHFPAQFGGLRHRGQRVVNRHPHAPTPRRCAIHISKHAIPQVAKNLLRAAVPDGLAYLL
jgi:hypothetical protein